MKKIIVPTDFSEYAEYALEVAASIAKKEKAQILLFHMIGVSRAFFTENKYQEYAEAVYYMKLARKKFDELLARSYMKGIETECVVQNYKAFSELNDVAKEKEADLIVMGSHGAGKILSMFVGSNTEKVVRHSDLPVLVVKDRIKNFEMNGVVFACDFEQESIHAYRRAMKFFAPFKSKVHLLHVNLPGESFRDTSQIEEKVRGFLLNAEGSEKRMGAVNYWNDYTTEQGIYTFSGRVNADLIAVLTHGRKGLAHFFMGSLAEDMANRSGWPVITFKMD
ncbi:universal stress protein [Sinomicrobium kalidii]|uniref:universal stress protein n=1 Tax=Sinomicrobium kalidii TaxID=2900738 RepID=UPI001E28E7BC|nr:universal stress protein [Sinomicrobium kalidii]UGU14677.1 universal stress protein [Sinomicrobium kalidii]